MMFITPHSTEILLIADPKVLAIPIIESNERFIDLKNQRTIAFGPSPEIENNQDYTKIRESVYRKLVQAQNSLPNNIFLCVYEGHRSLALQENLFNFLFEKNKKNNSNWNYDQCFEETTKLVSPVKNRDGSLNVPPHNTGGAIDLYLIDENGIALDMGIHPEDWLNYDETFALTYSNTISEEAKKNRSIMIAALTAVGFVNYPTEYWHWSFGDRYWAYNTNQSSAYYGGIAFVTHDLII